MIFSLTWLPEVLEQAGLKVSEVPGWRNRGRAPMGTVRGVICHHTATRSAGNMPSLGILINGRAASGNTPALSGPLCQLGLGRDGAYYVIAAGRANHAGAGIWEGIRTGNSSFIGIEAENNGTGETWPPVQLEAYQRGVAAILRKIGGGANMCCGHKEYAVGRKIDPDFDMPAFRRNVETYLNGKSPPPSIPLSDPQNNLTLRRDSIGSQVIRAQALLGLAVSGRFDASMEAKLRVFQRDHGLVPDGILGPKTWNRLTDSPIVVTTPAHVLSATVVPPPAPTPDPPPAHGGGIVEDRPAPAVQLPPLDSQDQPCRLDGRTALGPDGAQFARLYKRGFFTTGTTSLAAWIASGATLPHGTSSSAIRVVSAMSTVEGGVEAVNSYDDAYLSIGAFQWTAGSGAGRGELAALLALFKDKAPNAFDALFGSYGFGVSVASPTATTGFLTLDGTALRTPADKEVLRQIQWAYRFWRAAHHPTFRLCQFILATGRIASFKAADVFGRPLHDWLNSELAIALILDEHVNRPAHVPGTLCDAIRELCWEDADPTSFDQAAEHHLIEAYLEKRASTNMTDSGKRALKIAHFVTLGQLSDQRGSFG